MSLSLNLSPEQFTKTFAWDFTFNRLVGEVPFFDTTIVVENPYTIMMSVGACFVYLFCIFILFPALKPKSKETIETVAFYHHLGLCIYSFIAFAATAYYMIAYNNLTDGHAFLCQPVPGWLRFISITFTISKIWEWLDTAIMIWRGKTIKSIGFLHIYHHATTFFLFLVVMNYPGTEKYGMLFNGFVHTLMYYHYTFRLPKIFRPFITIAQIIQLFSATYIWYITGESCDIQMLHKDAYFLEYLVPYICVPVYGLFFVRFFFQEYVCKKSTKATKTIDTDAKSTKQD